MTEYERIIRRARLTHMVVDVIFWAVAVALAVATIVMVTLTVSH